MDRCPTCKARYTSGDSCYRCQTDLRQVLAVEQTALYHQEQALNALLQGRGPSARKHALKACEIHRSTASLRILALAALAERDFQEALILWRELSRP